MKKITSKKQLLKAVTYFILLIAIIAVSFGTGVLDIREALEKIHLNISTIIELFFMLCFVMAIEHVILWTLSLNKDKGGRKATLNSILSSLIKYVAAIVIGCWGLSIIGVNVGTIVASVGIVALIVGFGAESLIEDVITGMFILFEEQYDVGDIVEVGGFRGTVKAVGIRTTSIEDNGGNIKIINNSSIKDILNRSNQASKAVTEIDIPYSTDLEDLEIKIPQIMEAIFEKNTELFDSAPEYLGVQKLGSSGITLKFVASCKEKDIFKGTRVLNHDIFIEFRRQGIECPFTQIDVHTK